MSLTTFYFISLTLHMSIYLALLFFSSGAPHSRNYTLSLHDALPICSIPRLRSLQHSAPKKASPTWRRQLRRHVGEAFLDRKSTRLNSSHVRISYAVFCLKKKKYNESIATKKTSTSMPSNLKAHFPPY